MYSYKVMIILDKNPQGRGLQFFAKDPYFRQGTQLLTVASGTLLTAGHASLMFPLGVGYDVVRRVVVAPVQLVGLVASLLPSKKVAEVVVAPMDHLISERIALDADVVVADVVTDEVVEQAVKTLKPKVIKDLAKLGELIPGLATPSPALPK